MAGMEVSDACPAGSPDKGTVLEETVPSESGVELKLADIDGKLDLLLQAVGVTYIREEKDEGQE